MHFVPVQKMCTFYFPTTGRGKTDCQSALGILFQQNYWDARDSELGVDVASPAQDLRPICLRSPGQLILAGVRFISSTPVLSFDPCKHKFQHKIGYDNHMKSTLCVTPSGFLHSSL